MLLLLFEVTQVHINVTLRAASLTTGHLAYFHSLEPLAPQCKPQCPPWIAFMLWHEVRELLEHSTPTSQHSTPSSDGYSFVAVMPVNEPNKVFFNLRL